MDQPVPRYVQSAVPNSTRAPWYKNTFPSYAGIFLWVAFYLPLAAPTLGVASWEVCLLALSVAGLLCFGLYYYAPGMLGMKTGLPLYVVGTSTFGTTGGYVMPGLLMGLLQIGWFAVATYVSTDYILEGLGSHSRPLFVAIALVWAYGLAWVAVKGIRYVARVAQFLNWVPLLMILIVFWTNRGGIAHYQPARHDPAGAFNAMLAIVIGFFATAGAAGADFGMNNRDRRDVVLGGLTGITLAIVVAGGLPLLSVAGFIGQRSGAPNYDYAAAIRSVGALAPIVFFLFAAASVVPTCFCTFIASNSFGTMLPKIPKGVSTFVGVTVGAALALTGAASHLIGFFSIVGASFGPICGAITADFVLERGRWSGPRAGINWAGYLAWALGFAAGILEHIPGVPGSWVHALEPAPLTSYVIGFLVYAILARAGLRPPLAKFQSPA